ncbi:MAG: DUF3108 domain-containing protein [Candidatus Neomarinimicrobiota bacterium]
MEKIPAPHSSLDRSIPLTLLALVVALQAQPSHYMISWLGLPVVDVTVESNPGDSTLKGHFQARTRPWFDTFYSVDNQYWILLDKLSGQPVAYRKEITERDNQREFHVDYRFQAGKVVYANGAERSLEAGDQNLFGALLWVERHRWEEGEQQALVVEVEGIFWRVSAVCDDIRRDEATATSIARVVIRFQERLRGEAVLSRTDILTGVLPGVGNELRFEVDMQRRQILSIEFGFLPFLIRARLIPGNQN